MGKEKQNGGRESKKGVKRNVQQRLNDDHDHDNGRFNGRNRSIERRSGLDFEYPKKDLPRLFDGCTNSGAYRDVVENRMPDDLLGSVLSILHRLGDPLQTQWMNSRWIVLPFRAPSTAIPTPSESQSNIDAQEENKSKTLRVRLTAMVESKPR